MHRQLQLQREHGRLRRGLTLLELLIIIAVVAVLIFVALPTLKPTEEEASADFAKEMLEYLYSQEQAYYNLHGTYAPLSKLAADERIGRTFDQRFNEDENTVEEVVFRGPTVEAKIFDIIARLPDGSRYKIDQTGTIAPLQ
jgi:competence protein ComGC